MVHLYMTFKTVPVLSLILALGTWVRQPFMLWLAVFFQIINVFGIIFTEVTRILQSFSLWSWMKAQMNSFVKYASNYQILQTVLEFHHLAHRVNLSDTHTRSCLLMFAMNSLYSMSIFQFLFFKFIALSFSIKMPFANIYFSLYFH
jgi:hypothetical protein